jgi:hypothetical protein
MKSILITILFFAGAFITNPDVKASSITSMTMQGIFSSNASHKKKYKVTTHRNKHTCMKKGGCQSKTALIRLCLSR